MLHHFDIDIFLFQVLFRNANLTIERGEKIAILGPNGCGKSTLLKLIMGMEKPNRGEVLLGDHNVFPNYFEQNQVCYWYYQCPPYHIGLNGYYLFFRFALSKIFCLIYQAEALDLDKTVLETVVEAAEDWRLDDVKGLLGRYSFKAEMLDRKVSFLSGGEKVHIFYLNILLHSYTYDPFFFFFLVNSASLIFLVFFIGSACLLQVHGETFESSCLG